jgi:hypothetical protein
MPTETLTKEDIEILTNVVPELNLIPENAPAPKQLDDWQKRVGKSFHKFDAKTQKVDPRVVFVVDNLWPQSHTTDGKYTVTYRYHVFAHFGYAKDKDGELQDGRQGRAAVLKLAKFDFLIDVEKFLKDYKPAE